MSKYFSEVATDLLSNTTTLSMKCFKMDDLIFTFYTKDGESGHFVFNNKTKEKVKLVVSTGERVEFIKKALALGITQIQLTALLSLSLVTINRIARDLKKE